MNKILIFLIFPVFSGFSSLFTFLHFSLFLAYFGISLHIFVINFGKNFGKFQVCTKGKSAIGNRQVRNWGLRYILAFSHFSLIFIRSLWIDCFLKIFLCILKFNMSIGIHRNTDIRVSHYTKQILVLNPKHKIRINVPSILTWNFKLFIYYIFNGLESILTEIFQCRFSHF